MNARDQDRASTLRTQTADVLQVETQQEGYSESGAVVEQGRQVEEGEGAIITEEANLEDGMAYPLLPDHKARQSCDPGQNEPGSEEAGEQDDPVHE